uniref:holo-ACP synthase n=1 Tax=Herbidospora sakaeratensis TaxID=564415 RepID=UPI0007829489|nr:holo-ACP synthase [Herbidospora sakaeratensis]
MIVGIGVDLVDVARFAATLERRPALRERLFTEVELQGRSVSTGLVSGPSGAMCTGHAGDELCGETFADAGREVPVASLAARFAAKEAVAKSLGGPPGLAHREAEVVVGDHGRPMLTVSGRAEEIAADLGVRRWHLSLSHDGGFAVAYVIAEG